MMHRSTFLPTLLAVAALTTLATAACGDLSQEDLLFRAAVPSKAQLELRTAGESSQVSASSTSTSASTRAQALSADAPCGDGDLKCAAEEQARNFNALTFGLLDIVDAIINQPPTTRSKGKRVWGPVFLEDQPHSGKGKTVRFEMFRDGAKGFSFCLHAVAGRIEDKQARDMTCDVDVDADTHLSKILSGNFLPGSIVGDRARTGSGELVLRTDRVPEFNGIARSMIIDFDNTDSQTTIDIVLDGVVVDGHPLANADKGLAFSFHRHSDTSGDLHFEVLANIAKQTVRLERLSLDAKWNSEQAGRAEALVSEGDLSSLAPANLPHETQCWDASGTTVYVDAVIPGNDPVVHGNESQCVFTDAEVP